MVPRSSAEFYRSQQRLELLLVAHARREWAQMGADFDRSWVTVGPRLKVISTAAQLGAARAAVAYVPKVLAETNQHADAEGLVNASAFAGYAPDGRSLDGLLYGAVTNAKTSVGQGQSPSQALTDAGEWLDMVVQSIVADAGRAASGVGIAARPQVGGYVRMLNPPSCNRCAVLAGKWFRYNTGFARHPRCDCVHIPASENIAGDFRTDAKSMFDAGQVTGLTDAQTKAITDGADLAKVVNSTRGMSTTVTAARGRLTPEGIYQRATSRQDAIHLLQLHGYLL